ncbi:autotransporter outer membrane beta-barrel domain-containing protein [Lonepinella sp. BR2474]|uniref:autotransporter outer membrane beta-barrel domain-containing protein n=1 Tax=Lonepinella sp. BR2474 TaxID=3434548 RepID=UPI003F6E377F
MKITYFKYSALTLALMANCAVIQSVQAEASEVDPQPIMNRPTYTLKDVHIKDRGALSSLSLANVTHATLSNISISHSEKQNGAIHVSDSNVTINGLMLNATNPASYFSLLFDNSNVTINHANVNVSTKSSDNQPQGLLGALELKNRFNGNDPASEVLNSSFTNRADQSAVVVLAKNYAIFDQVTLNATGNKSTLFSLKDDSKLVAKNVTAKNIQGQEGLFVHIDTGGLKGETVKVPHNHDLQFEQSNIHATQGIQWMDAEGRMTLNLLDSTLQVDDQLVKINDPNDVKSDILTAISLDRSILIGGLQQPNSWVDIQLLDATWKVTSNSIVHNLSSVGEASHIYFEDQPDKFSTLTITGTYNGAHHFHVNSDISKNQSDKVILSGPMNDKSSATFFVTDQSEHQQFENPTAQQVTLLESADLSNQLRVTLGGENQYVNAGGYRYRLHDKIIAQTKIWELTNQLDNNGQQESDPDFNKPKEVPKVEQPEETPKMEQPEETPKMEQPEETPKVEQPEETPKMEQPEEIPKVEQPEEMPKMEQPEEMPKMEQPEETPKVEQPEEMPKVEQPEEMPKVEQPEEMPKMEQPEEMPKVEQPQVLPNVVPKVESKPMLELNDTANNLASLRAAQVAILDTELAGIHQRLGDVRHGKSTSVWTRSVNQTQKFDEQSVSSQSKTSGGTLDTYNLQLGAETSVTDNVRLGGFVSATAAKMDFDGSYSDAKLYSKAVALYASYLNDNGFYLDGIAKYSRLRSEFNAGGTSKKDVTYHYNAYTVSTEVGREFSFANQWSVTPQVQLGWSTISGNKYEDRLNVLHSKAGVRLAKGIQTSRLTLKPFAEVNGVYDKFNHNKVTLGQQGFDIARLGGRVETAVGLSLSGGNHSFSIQANNAYGKHIKQPWSAQATYRYQW